MGILFTPYVNQSAVCAVLETKDLKLGKTGKGYEKFVETLPDETRDTIDDFHFGWSRKGKGKGKKGKGKAMREEKKAAKASKKEEEPEEKSAKKKGSGKKERKE